MMEQQRWSTQFMESNKLGLSCAKLSISWILFCPLASLKFDCLVQTGTMTAKIFNTSGEAAIVNNQMYVDIFCKDKCFTDRCLKDKCCMGKCCMDKWYWATCQQSRMVPQT